MATTAERVTDDHTNDSAIADDGDVSPTTGANASNAFGSKWNPEATSPIEATADGEPVKRDRRMSREWDASKVPPSQFQKRKGSIYSTPGSRDGHVDRNKREWNDKYDKKKEKKEKS